jgi:hypothetical protein
VSAEQKVVDEASGRLQPTFQFEYPEHQESRRTKFIIIMGELDENVLSRSSLKCMDALMQINRDCDLMYLPSQNRYSGWHGYATRQVLDYFARCLMGAPPPQ